MATRRGILGGIVGLIAGAATWEIAAQVRGRQRGGAALLRPPLARDDQERRILGVLDEMERQGRTYLSVPPDDGRWLRVLTESLGARHVVEIGTSTGYSGLWLGLALARTGGRLTTLEIDRGRADAARAHFAKAGLGDRITVVVGDAHETVSAIDGPIDAAFIDADKEGYPDYLRKLLPKTRPGGLLLAHNVGMASAYVDAVTEDPLLETVFYADGGGLGVTLKKR